MIVLKACLCREACVTCLVLVIALYFDVAPGLIEW